MAVLLAAVSDLHCGSTVGLHPQSATQLDDGGSYTPTPAQGWLWARWREYWDTVKRQAKGHQLVVLLNGDLLDGDHHGTTQIISRHPGVQVDVLLRVLEVPLALKPAHVIVVRGTEAHVGQSASGEEAVAKALASRGVPVVRTPGGQFSWWHFVGELGGCRVSATHHGLVGSRSWTRASGANSLAAMVFYEHAARGERHPDVAIRSHRHKWADSGDNHPVRVLQSPAWQLQTGYAHKVAAESLADIGGLTVFLQGGQYHVSKHLYRPDPSPVWTMP